MPEVTQVDLDSFSFITAGPLRMSLFVDNFPNSLLLLPKFYWSGIYGSRPFGSGRALRVLVRIIVGVIFPCLMFRGGGTFIRGIVGIITFASLVISIWMLVIFRLTKIWAGLRFGYIRDRRLRILLPTFTTETDRDGGFYYVDLAIDGYVISGPSLD